MIKLNDEELKFGAYPNGEILPNGKQIDHLAHRNSLTFNQVEFKYESSDDLINLMFVSGHLDILGPRVDKYLYIRYMPYSRLDRAPNEETVFTLKYIARMINSMGFDAITVEEPHSDVTMALLDNATAVYPSIELLPEVLQMIDFDVKNDYIVYPDAGAQKRYAGITGYLNAVGYKHRDFETGKLAGSMDVLGVSRASVAANKALIVDDLCSRGGTFVMANKELRHCGFSEVYLLVTHCEKVALDGELLDHIDGLYCTDSILDSLILPDVGSYAWQLEPFKRVHVFSEGKWLNG